MGWYRKNGLYKTVSITIVTVFAPFHVEKKNHGENIVTDITERHAREKT